MRSSQHRSTSAQIASAFVSPEAIAPQIDAQNGTHGSHPVAAPASPHAIRVWAAPDGPSWRAYAPTFEELH